MEIRSVRWAAVAVVVVAVAGALSTGACSGDGSDGDGEAGDRGPEETAEETAAPSGTAAPAGPGEPDLEAYCDAELAFETVPAPDVDYAASPEEQAASYRTYSTETLRPLMDEVVAAAPEQLTDSIGRLSEAVDELARSGDYAAALEQPEVEVARGNMHAFDLANCGWRTQPVAATESAFTGVPQELDGGPTSFELTNQGRDLHQLVLVRKNDGVTATAQELLAMPEEESLRQVTRVGSAYAAQGERDHLVADLEPGAYIGACFLTAGTTSEDAPPPTRSMPHVALGMLMEFTVG